ncbi:MAG: SpoIVB peptidase S55 domain-containing protein [Candidatus Latescibacteria bacterium]|jgi:hypothetical protein|nr:SpoIVB peptidase S55 domain-containing protein [Candidatus Latescibacterota bacterium]
MITMFAVVVCQQPALANPETWDADDLIAGQKGVGYCVLQGTQLDSFEVEILGVQHDVIQPGRDLILARLSGANLEETGLFHGMSGSPVFVEGMLVGAVAHGWTFSMEPICGITPIREMLDLLEQDLSGPNEYPMAATPPVGTLHRIEPLPLPVWVSGAGRGVEAFLADVLEPMGMIPVTGLGASASTTNPPGDLKPGSSVGVQMVRGDMSVSAIGTVTWIEGDRVLAFGHPYLSVGAVDMPMTRTVVHGILPSQYSSFVLGSTGETIGALRQDRSVGVAGLLGEEAWMLPVAVTVDGPSGTRTLKTEVLDHSLLSSSLAQIVVFSALESAERLLGLASLDVQLLVTLSDGREVIWNQVFSGLHAPLFAARGVGGPIASLVWSGLQDVRLERVDVHIDVRDDVRVARIASVRHEPQQPRAGRPLTLQIELAPVQAPRQQMDIDVILPASARGLPVQIQLGSGSAALSWVAQRQDELPPRTSDELLRRLERPRRDDELVIEIVADAPGLSVGGQSMPSLPASVGRWLQQTPSVGHVGRVSGRVLHTQRMRVPYVLENEQVIDLGSIDR